VGFGDRNPTRRLEVFAPNGRAFTFPAWSFDRVLMPLIVRWGIYRAVRDNNPSV
jgi:apoptosis-inducing factor 2